MRLRATLAACLALAWPVAAAGVTLQADSTGVVGSATGASAADSAAASQGEPTPSEYVAALTREAMSAHLSGGRQTATPTAEPGAWKTRLATALVWVRTGARTAARLTRRPVVRGVLLPLVLLISVAGLVWRLGTSRGRQEALRASTERIRAVYDLAAGGARVPDIARRTHVAQEGVSLAMRLGDRRTEVLR
jgi:hypothetical protein